MIPALVLVTLLSGSPSEQLFQKGKAAFGAGNLTEALEAFTQARSLDKAPELLLNIAQCNRGLGRRAEAIAALEAFLAQAPRHPLRKAAEGTLADLRAEQTASDVPTRVELAPVPAAPAPLLLAPVEQPPRRVWPWVVGSVAAAAVAGAVVVGVVWASSSSHSDLGTVHVPPPQ